jgi:uncharacterized protein
MRLTPGIAVVACLLAGCASSPPMHYYTLSEVSATARLNAAENTTPVRLDRVTIPTEIDRAQIVRRIDATRLQIVENDRWAAPLDDTIRRVLSNELAARLSPNLIVDPYEPSVGEKRQSLSVDVQEFYGDTACAVTLKAAWVLKSTDTQSSRGTEDIGIPSSTGCGGVESLPTAMSQALAQLSDRIAAVIARTPVADQGH